MQWQCFFFRAPLPTMVFQWFCYPMTITIEWFFAEWPLTSMVFQCFYQIQVRLLTMVLVMRRRKCNISYFTTNLRNLQNALHAPFHPFHFCSIVLICTQHLEFMIDLNEDIAFMVLFRKRPHYVFPICATIEDFQWFSEAPSPLNGMVRGNHWKRWFSDGFGSANHWLRWFFDGWPPLGQRWNGYIPSLKSSAECKNHPNQYCIRILSIAFDLDAAFLSWYIHRIFFLNYSNSLDPQVGENPNDTHSVITKLSAT